VPDLPAIIENNTEFWLPDYYRELDVHKYITDLCPDNDQARSRVETELELFTARNLTDILRLLIHIVTILRKNNVVWGVGRGSSVASYCLYLLGVHRVDSIRYDLDIKEFLK
jgi:DNA polymerase III alpha subunit